MKVRDHGACGLGCSSRTHALALWVRDQETSRDHAGQGEHKRTQYQVLNDLQRQWLIKLGIVGAGLNSPKHPLPLQNHIVSWFGKLPTTMGKNHNTTHSLRQPTVLFLCLPTPVLN